MKDKTPIYYNTAEYAWEHGELDQYRASFRANVACKSAIEAAITINYSDNRLGSGAVHDVLEQFSFERIFYVLANTVREKDWDGRISHDNKEWAQTIPVCHYADNRQCYFVVDRSHTVLTNQFVTDVRHEYLMRQPLKAADIQKEAQRLLDRLQTEREPNSPCGTHFMAEVSPDFMRRARSRDTERLSSLLPFASLSLSTLKDRTGVYAMISCDEDRDQPLLSRRASVRNRLSSQPAQTDASTDRTAKHKIEPER